MWGVAAWLRPVNPRSEKPRAAYGYHVLIAIDFEAELTANIAKFDEFGSQFDPQPMARKARIIAGRITAQDYRFIIVSGIQKHLDRCIIGAEANLIIGDRGAFHGDGGGGEFIAAIAVG